MPKVYCSGCQNLLTESNRQAEYSKRHYELHKEELRVKRKERYQKMKLDKKID